MDFSKHAS
jgi:hypothetical protein